MKHVMVIAPICLDNEDLKEKDGEDLLYSDESYTVFKHKECLFRGLPIESSSFSPLVMLIPHIRS